MPSIPQYLRQRVSQHLGYSRPRAISPSLLQIFNQNCNEIQSNDDIFGTTGLTITTLLAKCDKAFLATDFTDDSAFSQFQQVLGDVNRRTRTLTLDDIISKLRENYLLCCDDLARFINVPNLQRPEVAQKHFSRQGDSYVLVKPNIPDTCISDRIYLADNFL
jgi:hypothetical protein